MRGFVILTEAYHAPEFSVAENDMPAERHLLSSLKYVEKNCVKIIQFVPNNIKIVIFYIKVFEKTVSPNMVQAFRDIFSLQSQHGLSVYRRACATNTAKVLWRYGTPVKPQILKI